MSVSVDPPDDSRPLFKGKSLHYLEQEMLMSVEAAGGQPFLIPDLETRASIAESLEAMDGLVLTGGADLAPESYSETARDPQWQGDPERDHYEMILFEQALARALPILGICRGCQLINVARGGSLFQDLATDLGGEIVHRDQDAYDKLEHGVELVEGTRLAEAYPGRQQRVNSVHHQGIKELGVGLRVAARAVDGVIEAIEFDDPAQFVLGVQWHPEWLPNSSTEPSFALFVAAARQARKRRESRLGS